MNSPVEGASQSWVTAWADSALQLADLSPQSLDLAVEALDLVLETVCEDETNLLGRIVGRAADVLDLLLGLLEAWKPLQECVEEDELVLRQGLTEDLHADETLADGDAQLEHTR